MDGRRRSNRSGKPKRERKTPEQVAEGIAAGWIVRSIRPHGETGSRWLITMKPEESVGARSVRFIVSGDPGEAGFAPGAVWDEDLAASAIELMHTDRARQAAVNALNRRALPRRKLVESLRKRGTPTEIAERVADEMERLGVVDDRAYAQGVARSLVSRQGAGRRLIEAKLFEKGVPRELAREAAAEVCGERDASEDAMAVARKKLRTLERFDDDTRRRRLYGVLARRGFDADVCRGVVDRALAEIRADDR